jgi:hypothetical protein
MVGLSELLPDFLRGGPCSLRLLGPLKGASFSLLLLCSTAFRLVLLWLGGSCLPDLLKGSETVCEISRWRCKGRDRFLEARLLTLWNV